MPRGPKGEERPADVVGNAIHVMKIATGEIELDFPVDDGKDKAAQALGRKGGKAVGNEDDALPSGATLTVVASLFHLRPPPSRQSLRLSNLIGGHLTRYNPQQNVGSGVRPVG